MTNLVLQAIIFSALLFIPLVLSHGNVTHDNVTRDNVPCPSDKSQLNAWFYMNVKPFESCKGSLDSALVTAEANSRVIKVNCDGSGDFKTINDAIRSIPNGNTNRVIISLGPGNYTENIKIESTKPFITFYGEANNMPTIICGGTAAAYGAADSPTLTVESDYFSAVNVIIVNSAPRPDVKRKGAQSVALRIAGDKASFYNCKFHSFQDTLCDVKGNHVFKDCYIEGTMDYMFGLGKSLYLNVETHIIPGIRRALNPPRARQSESLGAGYSFVHCNVTGTGSDAYLGGAWMNFAKVVYAYSEMHDVFQQPKTWFKGWLDMLHPNSPMPSSFFGQYSCTGTGSNINAVAGLMKQLSGAEAKPFLTLGFVGASKWLLPPIHI